MWKKTDSVINSSYIPQYGPFNQVLCYLFIYSQTKDWSNAKIWEFNLTLYKINLHKIITNNHLLPSPQSLTVCTLLYSKYPNGIEYENPPRL